MPELPNMNEGAIAAGPPRLKPEMASFRVLVLGFVRDYIMRTGISPSYGEIAHGLGTNRMRVVMSVRRLEHDGALLRTPGPRGLALPDACNEAMRLLEQMGFSIEPPSGAAGTSATLRYLAAQPVLDYPCDDTDGDEHGG